jgi:hypothetical protein
MLFKAASLLDVTIEVMKVAVIGKTADLEDGGVADEVEGEGEDLMIADLIVGKIGTVIEVEEVDMMMITVDVAGVGDEAVAMAVATVEIDTIIEAVVVAAADMGFHLDRLDL